MKIPVFVSAPSILSAEQNDVYQAINNTLENLNLESRAIGRSDSPVDFPLKEVFHLARRCAGGLVLGFVQQKAQSVILKPNTEEEREIGDAVYPSSWNQLEAGIFFGLNLPILVFKEDGISGGIFDPGVSDVFIHKMPSVSECNNSYSSFREIILKWQGLVRNYYYSSS